MAGRITVEDRHKNIVTTPELRAIAKCDAAWRLIDSAPEWTIPKIKRKQRNANKVGSYHFRGDPGTFAWNMSKNKTILI